MNEFCCCFLSLFLVNTLATEKLYELIGDWSGVSDRTVLLDICCGTGTIGLSLAKVIFYNLGAFFNHRLQVETTDLLIGYSVF